jgi:hypothetical protein
MLRERQREQENKEFRDLGDNALAVKTHASEIPLGYLDYITEQKKPTLVSVGTTKKTVNRTCIVIPESKIREIAQIPEVKLKDFKITRRDKLGFRYPPDLKQGKIGQDCFYVFRCPSVDNNGNFQFGILNSDPIPAIAALLPPEVISKKSALPKLDDDGTAALERLRALDPHYAVLNLDTEFNEKALVEIDHGGQKIYASKHLGFLRICKDGADSLEKVFNLAVKPSNFGDLNKAIDDVELSEDGNSIFYDYELKLVISRNADMKDKLLPIVLGPDAPGSGPA